MLQIPRWQKAVVLVILLLGLFWQSFRNAVDWIVACPMSSSLRPVHYGTDSLAHSASSFRLG